MLPAAARMRRRADFAAVVRGGGRVGRPLLTGHLLVRPGRDEPARVGFVVSRAVGTAPQASTARQADLAAELDLVLSTLLRRQGEALRR